MSAKRSQTRDHGREAPKRPTRVPGAPALRYPSNATFLKPEEQAEFGVGTVHDLVALLNYAWAKEGRRPLAQGSFPTSRVSLRFVLNEARRAGIGGAGPVPADRPQGVGAGEP